MFFYLSKLIWFAIQPSSLLALAALIGLVKVARGAHRGGLRWLVASLGLMAVIGTTSLADVLMVPLEQRFTRPALDGQRVDAIIVLGGAEDQAGGVRELMGLNEAAERMTEAVALARRLPDAKLVFSGGSGSIVGGETHGARDAGRLFAALGIEPSRVLLEDRSRTTHENAVETGKLLSPRQERLFLLVTSAAHMPRSVGVFRAQGFDVLPWPVDYRTGTSATLLKPLTPFPDGLRRFDAIVREYLGLLAYRLSGRTTQLLPGPQR